MAPETSAPAVEAKDIKAIRLYTRCRVAARADVTPFFFAYGACFVAMVYCMLTGRGHDVIWAAGAAGLCVLAHILLLLFAHWMVDVRSFVGFRPCHNATDATHCKVTPMSFAGTKELVPLERRKSEIGEDLLSFDFRKQRFCYDEATMIFIRLNYPVQERFADYQKASGYGHEGKVVAALEHWGPNRFDVPLPQFTELLKEQLLAPFFVFQVFCVGLWCLDSYWYYSVFTLGMLVMFECTVVAQRLKNLRELRALQTPKQALLVYRHGKWDRLPGDALLPGDLISIGRPAGHGSEERVVPADALLLAGTCIVEEAVLTGESTPQWKLPVGTTSSGSGGARGAENGPGPEDGLDAAKVDPQARLSIARDRAMVLFGGTKILQHTGDKAAHIRTPDGGCLAVVLRTGFETAQGHMMRTILYSTERLTANNWEVGLFILFLLVFAVAAAAYVLFYGLQDAERSRFKLVLNCTMIVTSVIPPELPMELSIAVNASLLALARRAVFCTEPFRITLAGKVAVCCFDKTGTLTSDNMVLDGIAGGIDHNPVLSAPTNSSSLDGAVPNGTHTPLLDASSADGPGVDSRGGSGGEAGLRSVAAASRSAARVLAACHSLLLVDGELVGDPLERAALQASGWVFTSGGIASPKGTALRETVSILHRFHFSSALKRMAVIAKVEADGAAAPEFWALVKGAPEVVQGFLASVPPGYEATSKRFASQGGRLIALALKRFDSGVSPAELREMQRGDLECGLDFAGFAVFQCPLKPDSAPALAALANASHQLVMITGDAPLTACHAAARLAITDRPVLILGRRAAAGMPSPDGGPEHDVAFEWASPDEATCEPFVRGRAAALGLAMRYDLCVSGAGLAHLHHVGAEADYVPLVQVFARVSPEQKEGVLRALRVAGWATLMCGDGTNDVGALKAAHVGVALLAPREPCLSDRGADARPAARRARGPEAGPSGRGRAAELATMGPGRGRGSRGVDERMTGRGPGALGRGFGHAGRGREHAGAGAKLLEDMRRKGRPIDPRVERMAAWMDTLEADTVQEVPMVKPGDASMAAPFTAKAGGVMPCTDIIRQGRSALVTTVQMFKILGLTCLSTAFSLSVMYLQGVKLGDFQATLTGMLSAALFFVISNAKPLETLSPERPHPNIFCAYVFASMLAQFAAHLGFLLYVYWAALHIMPEGERQAPDTDFEPNLVNTVCFLVNFIVQLTTFAVNYQGHPFNASIAQNPPLANTLRWGAALFVLLTLNLIPGLGQFFSLVPIPAALSAQVVGLALADFAFTWWVEQALRRAFPAARPPRKGYLAFPKELAALGHGQLPPGRLKQA